MAVPTKQAKRPGTTGSSGYRRQQRSFPQGQRDCALLGQASSTMSPQEHDNCAATAGYSVDAKFRRFVCYWANLDLCAQWHRTAASYIIT